MLKGILLGFGFTFIVVITQIFLAHTVKRRRLFSEVLFIFLTTIPLFIFAYWKIPDSFFFIREEFAGTDFTLGLVNSLFVYLFIFFNYIQCLYYLVRPVTLRILTEFLAAPGHFLTLTDLSQNYGLRKMIQTRLDLLVLNGYLGVERDGYELTGKGKCFAYVFKLFRRFFGIPYYLDSVQCQTPQSVD